MTKQTVNYDAERTKKKKFNILIIDEDHNIAIVFKNYLESRGHIVSITDEGTRGLMKTKNNNFDIIFVDYILKNNSTNIEQHKQCKSIIDGSIIVDCIKNINNKSLIFGYTKDINQKIINKFKKVGTTGIIFKTVNQYILNKFMHLLETKQCSNCAILDCFKKCTNTNSIIIF